MRQAARRYLVLDGQQRLRTLQHFYGGLHEGVEFSLRNVADEFKGLTYKKLSGEHRRLIDDAFIQATIVATDGSSRSLESIYQIFERLNSGGTQLTPTRFGWHYSLAPSSISSSGSIKTRIGAVSTVSRLLDSATKRSSCGFWLCTSMRQLTSDH